MVVQYTIHQCNVVNLQSVVCVELNAPMDTRFANTGPWYKMSEFRV